MLGEPITLKIKTMPYRQNWSSCWPHNVCTTALQLITHNLLALCYESHHISDTLRYQSDIYSPLQCHPTFTILHNAIVISAPFLWRLLHFTCLHFASTYSSPHYTTFITHVPDNNHTRILCLLIANNHCYLQAITTPPGLSPGKSCSIVHLFRLHNLMPHSFHQHASITILYLILCPITTLYCSIIPYLHPLLLYPA